MRVFRGLSSLVARQIATPSALTAGNFDGVHLGHRALLSRLIDVARQQGLTPTVATFEPHPREFFSPLTAPARLTPLREKLEYLADAGIERTVVVPFNAAFAALSAADFIEVVLQQTLKTRYFLIGDDFRFGAKRQGDFALLEATGDFAVEATPSVRIEGMRVSSSLVRQKLNEGDMAGAARLLGRPYAMDGKVVTGRQLGRQLGFATANLYLRHHPLPLFGVFAIRAHIEGQTGAWQGVANLGVRPTVEGGHRPILEAHLFDFEGNLYGKHLSVQFLHKLRDEQKFANIEALKTQIIEDARQARAFFQKDASCR